MSFYRTIGLLDFLAMIFFSSLVAFCLVLDCDCVMSSVEKTPTDQKVQVGNDQEKAQSEKERKTEAGKNQTNNKVLRP